MSGAEPISVVAAVIQRGDTWLLCQRPPGKHHAGLWEFPGGKVEPGESLFEAARRELAEELGLVVVALEEPCLFSEASGAFLIHFCAVSAAGEPHPLEHTAVRWVPRAELLHYALAPSDRAFVCSLPDPAR